MVPAAPPRAKRSALAAKASSGFQAPYPPGYGLTVPFKHTPQRPPTWDPKGTNTNLTEAIEPGADTNPVALGCFTFLSLSFFICQMGMLPIRPNDAAVYEV